jgi:hypothetical protein
LRSADGVDDGHSQQALGLPVVGGDTVWRARSTQPCVTSTTLHMEDTPFISSLNTSPFFGSGQELSPGTILGRTMEIQRLEKKKLSATDLHLIDNDKVLIVSTASCSFYSSIVRKVESAGNIPSTVMSAMDAEAWKFRGWRKRNSVTLTYTLLTMIRF